MSWDFNSIVAERLKIAEDKFGKAENSVLLDHIAQIEAALYTFTCPLKSLDISPGHRRSAWATSKLFPSLDSDDKYQVYNSDTKKTDSIEISDEKLHEVEYFENESISIRDGSKLDNNFEIIDVHQNAPAAYIHCGSISMEDVRRAENLLWPKK